MQLGQSVVAQPQVLPLEQQNYYSPTESVQRCEVDWDQDVGLMKWARNDCPHSNLVMYRKHQNDFVTRYRSRGRTSNQQAHVNFQTPLAVEYQLSLIHI